MCTESPWRVWSRGNRSGFAFSSDPCWHVGVGVGRMDGDPLRQLLQEFTGEEARARRVERGGNAGDDRALHLRVRGGVADDREESRDTGWRFPT